MIETVKQTDEIELTIERLEVVWECTEDIQIKNIITETIIKLQKFFIFVSPLMEHTQFLGFLEHVVFYL
jgi:hypothetical protein